MGLRLWVDVIVDEGQVVTYVSYIGMIQSVVWRLPSILKVIRRNGNRR